MTEKSKTISESLVDFRAAWRALLVELHLLRRDLGSGVELATKTGRVMTTGQALGLTEAETEEVAEVWHAWARERGLPRPWHSIREALVWRAMGDPWRPDEDFPNVRPLRGRSPSREIERAVAEGQRLASEREDLVARGVDPSELEVPLYPDDDDRG